MLFLIIVIIAIILIIIITDKNRQNTPTKRTVVKTRFVDSSHTATSSSQVKLGSAIARGAVGGLIGGPIGMVAGAVTAKKKNTVTEHHTTTFMVYYKNGNRKADTVDNSSDLYKLYMSKLDLGD
ncbi:MAG: hypothetical protein IKT47_03825 [Oscillospiraceae bacterium]|nr:hypothetical protein [Oscillospiraceae bacterium]